MVDMATILDFGLEQLELFLIYKSPSTKFRVNWLFYSSFQDGGHLVFHIGKILAIFDLRFIPVCPTKFQVNWPFGSGEEDWKKIFKMAAMVAILDFRSDQF